ncbi:hypothetical protein Rsub_12725 [Raphidocelis subcapitata]|uniref:Magnesium transporter n=1 Tax=Raphidocelis subcapitata TaxID=307507 RepID=A0A2V0PJM4_9CHLO|nr:hypothetical protein Rsub_12725 [Raphidocelis subcapitata]|eukprot:GBF99998.1 hypothetical protein Rsub_12725 [Raphidocelis subcapitata]
MPRSGADDSDHEPLLGAHHAGPADPEAGAGGAFTAGASPAAAPPAAARPGSSAKWHEAARDALALKRVAGIAHSLGVLPGLDVTRDAVEYEKAYGHIKARASISLTDYSRDKVDIVEGASNAMLPMLLDRPRPEWSRVRWLNIMGLSWELVLQLARRYDWHPLAVEDLMHTPQRIKADFYEDHLFVSLARFSIQSPSTLGDPSAQGSRAASFAVHGGAAAGPGGGADGRGGSGGGGGGRPAFHPTRSLAARTQQGRSSLLHSSSVPRTSWLRGASGGAGEGAAGAAAAAAAVAAGAVLPMELTVQQVSMFLMRDGTLITLFRGDARDVCQPIVERLRGLRTLLTDSEDASFLLNVLADQVVDACMPTVDVYARRISALEAKVLTEPVPRAEYTKELHLLANDCWVLRRALVPAQQLIHKLQSKAAVGEGGDEDGRHCLLSPLTRVYLSDVLDHVDTLVEDMEALAMQSKELIELIFNSISHQSNTSMQMLSIVNTVFLPLTFLAGVFGTNFTSVSAYQWDKGFWFFWGLCGAVTVGFIVVLRSWGMMRG